MVAERRQPGARLCDVAARYDVLPHHLSDWCRYARQGRLFLSSDLILRRDDIRISMRRHPLVKRRFANTQIIHNLLSQSTLVTAIRTASLRDSSVPPVPVSQLLC